MCFVHSDIKRIIYSGKRKKRATPVSKLLGELGQVKRMGGAKLGRKKPGGGSNEAEGRQLQSRSRLNLGLWVATTPRGGRGRKNEAEEKATGDNFCVCTWV